MPPFARTKSPPPPDPAPPEPAEPDPPPTIADIEAQLAQLDQRRAALRTALDELPTREMALIAADADDVALDALDGEGRHYRRALARLDFVEQDLLGQARALRAAERERHWEELVGRYRQASELLVGSIRETQRLHAAVAAISAGAGNAGFVLGHQSLPPPPPALMPDPHAAEHHEQLVRRVGDRAPPPPPAGPRLFAVRFKAGWNAYGSGDTAGLPSAVGWQLVDAGVAEWSERPPPRPPEILEARPPRRVRMKPIG